MSIEEFLGEAYPLMRNFPFVLFALLAPLSALAQKPEQLPDIDVLYIERTPRYPGYALDYAQGLGWSADSCRQQNAKPTKPGASKSRQEVAVAWRISDVHRSCPESR